jgi:hypothetical protein
MGNFATKYGKIFQRCDLIRASYFFISFWIFIVDNMFTNVIMNFPLINIRSNNGWDELFFWWIFMLW